MQALNPRQVLARGRKPAVRESWLVKKQPLRRGYPLHIGAISVTCGGALRNQLRPFVKQVRFFHPTWPIHIATDPEGAKLVKDLLGANDVVWTLLEPDFKQYGTSKAKDHGNRWNKAWIGIKLENFRRAVAHFKCGVLQCDSDFVWAHAFPVTNWWADVVMSTHAGPLNHRVPEHHGTYNAGMLLTDLVQVAECWQKWYRNGDGEFYEQKLMEQFDRDFVVDLFPAAWNWGPWRNKEDIGHNKRRPTLIHAHVTGPHVQDTPVHALAKERLLINNRSIGTHNRFAFFHAAKAAGSELMRLLHYDVLPLLQYQNLNSFHFRTSDWTEAELMELVNGHHPMQYGNRWLVHNHGQGWPTNMIQLYRMYGWQFFALYRPIRARLASFYAWSIDYMNAKGTHPMHGPITRARDINAFFEYMLTPEYLPEWTLPELAHEITWYPATDAGITQLIKTHFGITTAKPTKTNTSNNQGWAHYEKNITPEIRQRLEPYIAAWDAFAASL